MGIVDLAGWITVSVGAVCVGRALRQLAIARRSETRSKAIKSGVWSWLVGAEQLAVGFILLRDHQDYPHHTSLNWPVLILGTTAGMIAIIAFLIVYVRREMRLASSSAGTTAPGPATTLDDSVAGRLIERIRTVQFSTTRLAPGYDEEEVDIFLDKLVTILSKDGELYPSQVRNAQFSTTRLRPGYAVPEVDAFLDEVTQAT
jgi:DivIVA domain-containing protein